MRLCVCVGLFEIPGCRSRYDCEFLSRRSDASSTVSATFTGPFESPKMTDWLNAALDYIPRWIDFQLRQAQQPGCSIAIAHKGELVLEQAFGVADLASGEALTPRHRFRVASHSKTFTAVGLLKLNEQGRVRLDDAVGSYIDGLHPDVAAVTLQQLLSHSAGLIRDGGDASDFQDRKPFRTAAELKADLALAPLLPAAERFKYSNHGFGLLGLVIAEVTKEPFNSWAAREVVQAAGLRETSADIGGLDGRLARGHTLLQPLGHRLVIPGDNPTNDVASATGFVSTASDLARFFAQLAPKSEARLLSPLSRREMTRRHWRDHESTLERWYGLGTISGTLRGWDWFGHSGSFQGTLSRTSVFTPEDLAVSVLTNAIDGPAQMWVDGIALILKAYRDGGAPSAEAAGWASRWWTLWGAVDLVPVGARVLASAPALMTPLAEVSHIELSGRDSGKVVRASGFASPGEGVRRVRNDNGEVAEVWLGGQRLVSEAAFVQEIAGRYGIKPGG